jgi:hypothetical protein
LLLIIAVILASSVGFHLGWYGKQLLQLVKELKAREPEPVSRVVTPKPAGYADVNNMTSGIITPKPPSVIRLEEEERLRNM